jgi:5-methylcytosine-specific restriction protein A
MLRRACLYPRCRNMAAPGGSYCDPHLLPRQRAKSLKRNAQRRNGNDAARRLRRQVNTDEGATCGRCLQHFPATFIEVDHLVPLADGGRDVEGNVWALCKDCHRSKTTAETQRRARG